MKHTLKKHTGKVRLMGLFFVLIGLVFALLNEMKNFAIVAGLLVAIPGMIALLYPKQAANILDTAIDLIGKTL